MKLTHNDDGKGKFMSHTVSIMNDTYLPDIDTIEGFGATREEAFEEFINKFDMVLNQMLEFRKSLNDNQDMIEVDYSGKPLED